MLGSELDGADGDEESGGNGREQRCAGVGVRWADLYLSAHPAGRHRVEGNSASPAPLSPSVPPGRDIIGPFPVMDHARHAALVGHPLPAAQTPTAGRVADALVTAFLPERAGRASFCPDWGTERERRGRRSASLGPLINIRTPDFSRADRSHSAADGDVAPSSSTYRAAGSPWKNHCSHAAHASRQPAYVQMPDVYTSPRLWQALLPPSPADWPAANVMSRTYVRT
ncbi:hypothetical protein C8Q79DRAFT_673864 [Trametes meyenii]|nr:hypothetical protein C8Q79DRAFT_673864 [Trametes meyenii]